MVRNVVLGDGGSPHPARRDVSPHLGSPHLNGRDEARPSR